MNTDTLPNGRAWQTIPTIFTGTMPGVAGLSFSPEPEPYFVTAPEPGVLLAEAIPALQWNPALPSGNQGAALTPAQTQELSAWLSAQASGLVVDNLLMLNTDGKGNLYATYTVLSEDMTGDVYVATLRPGISVVGFGPLTIKLQHDFALTPKRDWPLWLALPTKP